MLDSHKASLGAAFDAHKAVVADARERATQMFNERLATLSEAADQSTRVVDARLADMAEAANRNAQQVSAMLDSHEASIDAALGSHEAVAPTPQEKASQMFDARLGRPLPGRGSERARH